MATLVDWSLDENKLRRALFKLSKKELIKACKYKKIKYKENKKDTVNDLIQKVTKSKKNVKKQSTPKKKKKPIETKSKIESKTNKNKKKMNQDTTKDRKIAYRFGYRNLQCIKPSTGYPNKETGKKAVQGKLELFYAHGYNGQYLESRQNLYLSKDLKYLIYFIASVVVVYDYQMDQQKFFKLHNDDVSAICLSPRTTLCASGQKDPKDMPGMGKDLPKIYVWNYKTMKKVQLISNVCWGKIAKLQWSSCTNYLYCICGDPDQTLKAWNPADFDSKKKELDALIRCNTMRELILGFVINPKPNPDNVDELLIFAKRKFAYCYITKTNKGLRAKLKSVSIVSLRRDGEKAFACGQFLDDGRYLVGSSSGSIYVGQGAQALAVLLSAHSKSIGAMCLMRNNKLLTAGSDNKLKEFTINDTKGGKGAVESGLEETSEWMTEMKDVDTFYLEPRAMAYNNQTRTIFCGTKSNKIIQFEIKAETMNILIDGHDGQIWGLCSSPNYPIYATGGYDKSIKIWNAGATNYQSAHNDVVLIYGYIREIEKSYDSDINQYIMPTSICELIYLFYFFKTKCVATYTFGTEYDRGHEISCAAWSNDGDILAFGTENSNIAIFTFRENVLKYHLMINIPPKNERAEIEAVSYLRFSKNSNLLAAAHFDSNLYIYSVTGYDGDDVKLEPWYGPLFHVAAPTNIQFSSDGKMIKVLTRDYEIAHWSLDYTTKKGRFIPIIPDPDKVQWADDPLIAGWDTQGLYQIYFDGTDLNDAALTSDKKLIASGDDYGIVRLHNYPAINPTSCLEYFGHSEFVVGVEFLCDDSQLITVGGNDMAIFQWRLNKSF